MTISFSVSKDFHKELKFINQGVQNVATAHNLFTLECEFHRLSGYLLGLQQVMYTDELDLYAIHSELIEIKRVRWDEIMKADASEHTKWFGNCKVEVVRVVVEVKQ